MAGWRDRTLLDLLTEHGLELSPEHAFPTDGWSGATFTGLIDPAGRRLDRPRHARRRPSRGLARGSTGR
jgi:hypothetical protein